MVSEVSRWAAALPIRALSKAALLRAAPHCLGHTWSLCGNTRGACLLWGGPVEVSDVAGIDCAVVVRIVDRAVDCVATLWEDAVGCVVAWVTVGPLAVVQGVSVWAGAVARVVTAEVVLGDSAGNGPSAPSPSVLRVPATTPTLHSATSGAWLAGSQPLWGGGRCVFSQVTVMSSVRQH